MDLGFHGIVPDTVREGGQKGTGKIVESPWLSQQLFEYLIGDQQCAYTEKQWKQL